jgi:hypothetical protein
LVQESSQSRNLSRDRFHLCGKLHLAPYPIGVLNCLRKKRRCIRCLVGTIFRLRSYECSKIHGAFRENDGNCQNNRFALSSKLYRYVFPCWYRIVRLGNITFCRVTITAAPSQNFPTRNVGMEMSIIPFFEVDQSISL